MALPSGTYYITNTASGRTNSAYPDPDTVGTARIRADVLQRVPVFQWTITQLANKQYTIQPVASALYAFVATNVQPGGDIGLAAEPNTQWIIQNNGTAAQPTYTISNGNLFWDLSSPQAKSLITMQVANASQQTWKIESV